MVVSSYSGPYTEIIECGDVYVGGMMMVELNFADGSEC